MAGIARMKKIVPLIMCEISFCRYVFELVFGVNVTDLDLGVQIDPVKQPIQSNSAGQSNMPRCGTSTFDNDLNYCLLSSKTYNLAL